MPGSLRVRLPALFLLGIVLGGLVASAIAFRLFQDLARDRSLEELRREAVGIASLYSAAALRGLEENAPAPDFAGSALGLATGDRLWYIGANPFPGEEFGLDRLPESLVPVRVRMLDGQERFTFVPPDEERGYLAVSQPLVLETGSEPLAAIVVGKPEDQLANAWPPLLARLLLAFAGGTLLAGLVGWWMSRRISGPVLLLAEAAEEIAEGNYDVRVDARPKPTEIHLLAERFNEMATRLGAAESRERQFLMSVSHELRTPLTAIKGHVEALRDGVIDDPGDVAASLDVVATEAVRLERLVGDIVDLAKLRAHRFTVLSEEVDMGRLVELALGGFADEARRRSIASPLRLDGEPPTILTDGNRVLQTITNLLQNAFRWTPDGGTVGVALATTSHEVVVEVRDTGPGIPLEDQETIFEVFVSGDTQGTGLGLPIARELATALGGRVELESRPGDGSLFRLVLPLRLPD